MAIAMPMASPAMQLDLPGNAVLAGEKIVGHGSYQMPISAWEDGAFQTIRAEGEITQQAWKITASGLTSLQILEPLKAQLSDAGFDLVFECETEWCGGFDFRFNTDVMSEPAMHIDLGDFRFLAAQRREDAHPEYISLLVSRSQNAGFVQLMRVGVPSEVSTLVTSTKSPALTTITEEPAAAVPDMPLEQALLGLGRFTLEDLIFQTGSSNLGDGPFESLTNLANYLQENPDRTFMLVGHTDAEGSLAGNIALSKKRARSVVRRLVSEFGVNKNQISAEGSGFLSPLASNLTEDGRAQNRRVEVIVTSTQ
ncbi:MAG: OmpA family protein [Marinosulfonomonas sp.]|nr:OmpA family protein [Marinosulfonomonas sp.]